METYDVLCTTPATREFLEESVSDQALYRVLDYARFAPSGRNRQGWRVIVIRDPATKREIGDLLQGPFREYVTLLGQGTEPFSALTSGEWQAPDIDLSEARARTDLPRFEVVDQCAVLLVICTDLTTIAFMDALLERQSISGGASIYPFVQNILLGLRNEGLGGVPITFLCREEPSIKRLLGIPERLAIACGVALGRPARSVTRLRRRPVEEFATWDTFAGTPFEKPAA